MKRWIEADQVADFLEPGMNVFVAGATAEPREILWAGSAGRDSYGELPSSS